jgi:3-oxoacyl-(acyl-carrier-protein) synthase
MARQRRVVISGVGLVSAAGVGVDEVWRCLRTAPPVPVLHRGPPPAAAIEFPLYRAAEYRLADLGLPRRCLRWLADEGLGEVRDLRHLLAGTALALQDAGLGLDCAAQDPPAALVVGDESPGFEGLSQALFALGHGGPLPDDPMAPIARYDALAERFFQLNGFLLPHYLARAFGFRGLTLFVNSACTSGLNAVDLAAQQIRAGRCRMAVAAAADDPLSVAKFLWFDRLGLYARDGTIRPFDAGQCGTVFGDGGAALVLEDRDSARARGARCYAEYLGAGFAQDGWKITVPHPVAARAADAVVAACREAGVQPAVIDLVVPHGVGTAASDAYEALVLHRLFRFAAGGPAVTALKPYVGHNLGGSALLELALLALALERQAIPPTLGHRTPLPRHPVPLVTTWQERRVGLALKMTCGFAGHYGAVVLRGLADER